jgi:hypothetical protein
MTNLERDADTVISAEAVKKLYDELVTAGFTESQAIDYMTSFLAKYLINLKIYRKEFGEKK